LALFVGVRAPERVRYWAGKWCIMFESLNAGN